MKTGKILNQGKKRFGNGKKKNRFIDHRFKGIHMIKTFPLLIFFIDNFLYMLMRI